MDSQSSRHYNAQEQGNGSYPPHDRTPPISHVSGGQPMSGHSQTTVVPGYGTTSGYRGGGGGGGSGSVKLPPSMMHNRTAPQEVHMRDGSVIVSVEQIIMKLDMASEENVRLRNTLHANNQLLDQKLKQFEPIIRENERLKDDNRKLLVEKQSLSESSKTLSDATYRFFEARVAVMGFKCRTMQLQGELDELKKKPSAVDPDEYGRLRQHLDQVLRDNKTLQERNKALSSRAQPGGMDQAVVHLERVVGELNRNIQSLTNEKKSHETIMFQLQQDLKSVQDKKQLAEEEVHRAQSETARLRDQMHKFDLDNRALSRQLEQLQGNIPQDSSSVHAQYESQNLGLQARVQELMEHIAKVEDQVAAEKRMNEQLQGKVAELQEAKSAMRSKLQSYTGSEPPSPRGEQSRPTPTPRTNLQPAMHALQADKERLEAENKQLQERLDTATRVRTTVEEQFQQSSQKAQGFAQEKYQLERRIEAKESQLSEQKRAYQSLEQEFERVRREKDQMMSSSRGEEGRQRERIELLQREKEELRSQVAHLEMEHAQRSSATSALEREKLEYRGKIARLEEQLRQMQLESPGASVHEMTSMKTKTAPLAKRLNDALGRIRELETLNKGLEDKQAETQQEHQSLRDENRSLRTKVEVEHENLRLAAESKSAANKREIDELRAEQSRLCEDKFKLQQELEHIQGDLVSKRGQERQLTEQLQNYERQLAEKNSTVEQLEKQRDELRAQFDSTQQDKDKKNNKLSALQTRYTDTKKRLDETKSEKDRLQTTVHQLEGEREQLTEVKRRIEGEKNQLEKTVKEYRTESESILTDYTQAMAELRQTKDDKENLQQMFTKTTHDLNQQRERSRLLEVQRKEVQDKLSHMDAQLKLYHEDFERERHAREAAIKVKNLAEERMKKMERDMKELRDRLNQQAARRLREDQYDDQPGPTEYRKSGEHRFSGSQPSNLTEPNRFMGPESRRVSGGHPHSGGQQESPPRTHSGHQQPPSAQPQHMLEGQPSGAPPIPPKGTPPSAGVGAFGMGGAVGGATGGAGGGVMPLRASDTNISGSPGHMGGGMGGVGGGMGGVGGGMGGGGRPLYAQTTTHYSPTPPRAMDRVNHPSTMMVTGRNLSMTPQQDPGAGRLPLRASTENQFPPHGFPGPTSQSGMGFGSGYPRPAPPPSTGAGTAGGGLNNLDGPGVGGPPHQPGPFQTGEPVVPGGNPPNQLNNLNQPPLQGDKYVAPGEVLNEAPPSMACPLCGKADFMTQTDLELHCAQCN